jgi:hypothetical protein
VLPDRLSSFIPDVKNRSLVLFYFAWAKDSRRSACRQSKTSWRRTASTVYAAVAWRFNCPLITLDREQHDGVASILAAHYPVDLLPSF